MMNHTHRTAKQLTTAGLCLALCIVLPFLSGQIRVIGNMLCLIHLPVLLCGFICGGPWGLAVGFVAPLLRSALFHAPVFFPNAVGMAFELATYGFVSGVLYRRFKKTTGGLYAALLLAMLSGRIVWGAVRFLLAGLAGSAFPLSAFLAGAVTEAIPGIILQLVLIPILVIALKKTKLMD